MNSDDFFMYEALKEAVKGYEQGEVPVGAILVDKDGGILLRAHNECEQKGNPLAHAELLILERACELGINLEEATLYVTLEPCLMCASAIMLARVNRLVYGAQNHLLGGIGSIFNVAIEPNFKYNIKVRGGVLAEETQDILKRFFKNLRRNEYGEKVHCT